MKIITGDITQQTEGLIAHGVNCQGVMGSGVALAIRQQWPKVFASFLKRQCGQDMLGFTDLIWINEPQLMVANCYTQEHFGRENKRYASPLAILKSLRMVFMAARVYKLVVKMPKIGCGLGGLDWDQDVKPIVELLEDEEGVEVEVYVLP